MRSTPYLPALAPGTPVTTSEIERDDVRVLEDMGGTWVQVVYDETRIGYITRDSIILPEKINGT